MMLAIIITTVLLLLSVVGVIIAIRVLRGALRAILAVAGVLFSLFLALVVSGEIMAYRFMPETVNINPAKYKGPTGQIITPLKGNLILMIYKDMGKDPSKYLIINSKDGAFTVPTGNYTNIRCMQVIDRNDEHWTISLQTSKKLNVLSGSTYHLDIGPPYTASIKVEKIRGNRVSLGINMVGRNGESCTITNLKRSAAPGFQIISKSGEVLQEGKFSYG